MHRIHRWLQYLQQHRMLIFLCCLLLILIVFPFVHEHYSHYLIIIEGFFTLLLIAGIHVVSHDPQTLTISILIALMAGVVAWFNLWLHSPDLQMLSLLLQIIFFTLTTITIISHVLSYQRVNADKIHGAISAYLLLGIIWAMIYTALELHRPDSFSFPNTLFYQDINIAGHRFYFSQFLYFSFVSLTTLGYGDIVPISFEARGFAAIEAVTGQLYVAVLIARLVGLHISHTHWEKLQAEQSQTKD